jgi:hypothetical protein
MDRSVGYAGLGRATLLENTFRKHHIGALLYGPDQVVRANKFNTNLTGVYLGTPHGNFVALQGTGWSTNPQDYPVSSTLTLSCNEFDQPGNNPEDNALGVLISDGVKLPNIGGNRSPDFGGDPAGNVWPKTGFTPGTLPSNCLSGLCDDINESPSIDVPNFSVPVKTSAALQTIYYYYSNEYVYPSGSTTTGNMIFRNSRGITLTGDNYGESTCPANCPWDIIFDQHFKVDNCSEIGQENWPLKSRGVTGLDGTKVLHGISIYPNPAMGSLTFRNQTEERYDWLLITDVLGKTRRFALQEQESQTLSLAELSAGCYSVAVMSPTNREILGNLIITK